mgnify:CR=1 FL=1
MSTPDATPDGIDRTDQEREAGAIGPLSPAELAHGEKQLRGAKQWDDRYRATELVWGTPPDPWIVEQVTVLPPGRALDVGAGEGRHALWLATRAWDVTGSPVSEDIPLLTLAAGALYYRIQSLYFVVQNIK